MQSLLTRSKEDKPRFKLFRSRSNDRYSLQLFHLEKKDMSRLREFLTNNQDLKQCGLLEHRRCSKYHMGSSTRTCSFNEQEKVDQIQNPPLVRKRHRH